MPGGQADLVQVWRCLGTIHAHAALTPGMASNMDETMNDTDKAALGSPPTDASAPGAPQPAR